MTTKHKKGFYEKYIKVPIDVIFAIIALVVLSPVLLVVAVLVRTKLGSPVIFKQERAGIHGKSFYMYKFRTMTDERDENGNYLPDEVRLTKFGALLRSTSLDELPSLWNVIKTDISLVGPRCLYVRYNERYNENQRRRLEVRPGITGLAQVNGRNNMSWEEKFEYDIEYVDNITFVGDVKIIFLTVWKAFVKEEGISAEGEATMGEFTGTKEDVNV